MGFTILIFAARYWRGIFKVIAFRNQFFMNESKPMPYWRALPLGLWGGLVSIFEKVRDCFSQPYLWEREEDRWTRKGEPVL
jgi:hypothetical protein